VQGRPPPAVAPGKKERIMKLNESNADRVIRVVVGLVLGYFAFTTAGALSVVLWILAAVLVVTGAIGFCPLYRLLGFSTRR